MGQRRVEADGDAIGERHQQAISQSGLDVLLVNQGLRPGEDSRGEHGRHRCKASSSKGQLRLEAPHDVVGLERPLRHAERIAQVLEIPVAPQLTGGDALEPNSLSER